MVDVERALGTRRDPLLDVVAYAGSRGVRSGAGNAGGGFMPKLMARVERLTKFCHPTHPMIQNRAAKFDADRFEMEAIEEFELELEEEEELLEVESERVAEPIFAEIICEKMAGTTRHDESQYDDLHRTRNALQKELRDGEVCQLLWKAIVNRQGSENSLPSVVAVVVNKNSGCEAALFILATTEPGTDPVRVRAVLPLTLESSVHMMGSGTLCVQTRINGTYHLHMSSVQSLWVAFSSVNSLLENMDRRMRPNQWISTYQEMSAADNWDSPRSESMSSCSSRDSSMSMCESEDAEEKREIVLALRAILHGANLDELTCAVVYSQLKDMFGRDMKPKYKRFIDEKMIMVMGQMESPTEILDGFLYLGSEWNAGNLEELEQNGIDCILNATKEVPPFYPDRLIYHRVPIWDRPSENLLAWLPDAVDFLCQAERRGSRCLVHCQRGISRSASLVIAFAMKSYGWPLEKTYRFVKSRRGIVKPNEGFWQQLVLYEKILMDRGYIVKHN